MCFLFSIPATFPPSFYSNPLVLVFQIFSMPPIFPTPSDYSVLCPKFPEKLLHFKKVANLNINHAHIHRMINQSINFGLHEHFFTRNNFSILNFSLHFVTSNLRFFLTVSHILEIFINKNNLG